MGGTSLLPFQPKTQLSGLVLDFPVISEQGWDGETFFLVHIWP